MVSGIDTVYDLRDEVDSLRGRVEMFQPSINSLQGRLDSVENRITQLETKLGYLIKEVKNISGSTVTNGSRLTALENTVEILTDLIGGDSDK